MGCFGGVGEVGVVAFFSVTDALRLRRSPVVGGVFRSESMKPLLSYTSAAVKDTHCNNIKTVY